MNDKCESRFGYYICWGVCTWIPAVYCLQSIFLATNAPIDCGFIYGLVLFIAGSSLIYIEYDIDLNRQVFREDPKALIWGKRAEFIEAYYFTADNKQHKSLLLLSGGWNVARHWNYTLEILLTLCWTAMAKFSHILPWTYLIFLVVLLTDRAKRDERRCAHKYAQYWNKYVEAVPYSLIPGIY